MSGPRDFVQILEVDSRSKWQTVVNLDYLRNLSTSMLVDAGLFLLFLSV